MRLRVLERLDEGEVARNLFGCWSLQQQVLGLGGGRLGEGVGRLGERLLGDGRGGGGARGVEILDESSAEIDDGSGGVDGDSGEKREVLAAVSVGGKVRCLGVGEQDQREGGNLPIARSVCGRLAGRLF